MGINQSFGRGVAGGAELKDAWVEMLATVEFDFMATLTFDPKRIFPVGRERADVAAVRWARDVGYYCRREVGYIITTERHRSGQWHAHALLAGVGGRVRSSFITDTWTERNGRAEVTAVHDGRGAVAYLLKSAARPSHVVWSDGILSKGRGPSRT